MTTYSDDYSFGTLGGLSESYVPETFDQDPTEWLRGGQDSEDDQRDRDVFASGFYVETGGATRWKIPTCRYCGTDLFGPALRWICEVAGDVTERPTFTGYVLKNGLPEFRTRTCKCNACEFNAIVYREGRPPTVCTGSECVRRRRREERAGERERRNERDRELAIRWIVSDSSLSDRHIAELTGVRPKRVREARELIPA